ncbi:MAG TPA: hypothetical protein VMC85_12105 [Desulfomonilaceae bacterium]|nr:hypothetical protein [Desulfomonilaceae bacterium]
MKLIMVILTLGISVMMLPVLSYNSSIAPSDNLVAARCDGIKYPFLLAQTDYGGEFDLNYCQYECRMRYGLDPSGLGGAGGIQSQTEDSNEAYQLHQGSTVYYQYANCLADCQKKFWQEFERKSGGTGKTR